MQRRLLHLAAVVSLMLLLATPLAWFWLGRYERSITWVRPNSQLQVGAFSNAIIIERTVVTWSLYPRWKVCVGNFSFTVDRRTVGSETGSDIRLHSAGGATMGTIRRTFRNTAGGPPHQELSYELWLPYWLFMVLMLPLPLWVSTFHRQRLIRYSRRLRGECEYCGYDLRASPEQCPECGAVAKSLHNKTL